MRSALYYPHTTVQNENLLKTSLLLWDKLEFIVPWKGFEPRYKSPIISRAMELVGAPRVPDDGEKKETHEHIEELVQRRLPPHFYYGRDGKRDDYEVYPQKLFPETWELLRRSQLSGERLRNSDYPMTEPVGLTIMSILADCCAGKTRSRVTDKGAAYAMLAGILGNNSGDMPDEPELPHEQLVPITLDLVDVKSVALEKLIAFREREEKEGGHTIRDLRHRYVDALETYVKRLTSEKANASDSQEIRRQFMDDMKIDTKNLRQELGYGRRDALLSKEVLVAAIAGIGTIATWTFGISLPILGVATAAGIPATVGGLLGAGNKYLSSRRSIMQRHPMAYMYELSASQSGIWPYLDAVGR